MTPWQQSREDDNFRQALRALPIRGATPRVVELTDEDMRKVRWAAARRRQGFGSQIRDLPVLGRVAALFRA
jgi:hypothetical protein